MFYMALSVSIVSFVNACATAEGSAQRFVEIPALEAGIAFQNLLPYTDSLNPYTYKSFFNGGGVGIGDLDGDDLPDLIFTGNLADNAVYLNRGNWIFEDVTELSGLGGKGAWNSGVTLADVNGDGLLDVYLCKSGPPGGPNRRNELRINQGDGTFVDIADQVGLDELGFSIQGVFFDYDRDGDLDLYLLSNSIRPTGGFDLRPGQREVRDTTGGNKLFRNEIVETGRLTFTDVSAETGIYGSSIGFGLGVAVGDVNGDEWPDLYVSNDFFERDYLYINRGGSAGFVERLTDLVPEIAMGAMGADMADVDGDGTPEIFVSEMLPKDPTRYRSKTVFESYFTQRTASRAGYHRQFGRNVLLQNDGTGRFADIGRMAGVEATDWSWGAFFADLDNDGWRDLYVTNGTFKDPLDQDYLRRVANSEQIREWISEGGEVVRRLIDSMPSEPISNVAFRNLTGEGFADATESWGLRQPSFSNGAAYGDLDGDGDLDLVVNVANGSPLLYRNQTDTFAHQARSLTVTLGDTISVANRLALGSKVAMYAGGSPQVAEAAYTKGFMSSVQPLLHFGLATSSADSVIVRWSSGGVQTVPVPPGSRALHIERSVDEPPLGAKGIWGGSNPMWQPAPWRHRESASDDTNAYPFLPEMHSAEGPALAVSGDVGGERLVFVGGAKGYASVVMTLSADGIWGRPDSTAFVGSTAFEHVEAVWADIDGDGDEDLIVGAGGDESVPAQSLLRLQVYRRNSSGDLELDPLAIGTSSDQLSCGALVAEDMDGDGDVDLFFGTHFKLGAYGQAAPSLLLDNDGTGRFTLASRFDHLDRVKAAVAIDFDGNGTSELVVAQEFGPVTVYGQRGGRYAPVAAGPSGLWQSLAILRTEGGTVAIIAGNHGLNSRLRASPAEPLTMWQVDIDSNGALEQFLSVGARSTDIPLVQLQDLVAKVPLLRKRYTRFKAFAKTTTTDVLAGAKPTRVLAATELRSGVLRWDLTSDTLSFRPLPDVGQTTTTRALAIGDGASPIIYCAGNFSYVKPEFGGQMSGFGVAFVMGADGKLTHVRNAFPYLRGEVRGLRYHAGSLIAARNEDTPLCYNIKLDRIQ